MSLLSEHHDLTVALQEAVHGRESDVKVERLQDLVLLVQNLLLCVRVVRNVHKVLDFRHVDFFIFASNEHRSHTQQLVLATRYLLPLAVPVNQVDSDEECLWVQRVLQVDLDEPRDQDSSHPVGQIRLVRAASAAFTGLEPVLRLVQVIGAGRCHVGHVLRVTYLLQVALSEVIGQS